MHAGRVEEAGALARQIGRDITRRSKHQLSNTKKTSAKKLWKVVRQLTGRKHDPEVDSSITAAKLNQHYASVSTDASYECPLPKESAINHLHWLHGISDYQVFKFWTRSSLQQRDSTSCRPGFSGLQHQFSAAQLLT